ncbi:hypothetical protein [Bremerella volcania]|uniref:hypothetical protein n=1 Tax=Bremerella volcania TaxID=2527984 RepID=UPI0011A3A3BC|nr:hypothetical protein [Bremerella volcania]
MSTDALRYFDWVVRELLIPHVKSPDGCQILLASGYNKPRREPPPDRSYDCETRPIWTPWGWAVDRSHLTWLIVNWCFRNLKCFAYPPRGLSDPQPHSEHWLRDG